MTGNRRHCVDALIHSATVRAGRNVALATVILLGLGNPGVAEEVSPGGSVIHRYDGVTPDTSTPESEAVHAEDIGAALEPLLGDYYVSHEIVSMAVHMDVLVFPPSAKRNAWTFVTSGMSDKSMSVPDGLDSSEYGFAELVIAVPPEWFTKDERGWIREAELEDENKYWPIRNLKYLGRFPHEYQTWFWESHSIPNGNPVEPFAASTKMDGVVLAPLSDWPEHYRKIKAKDGTLINLFAVVPVYPEEMQAKLDLGFDTLMPALLAVGVTEKVNAARANVAEELLQ